MRRWRIYTVDNLESYTFEINPNAQSTPYLARPVEWDYDSVTGFTGRRAGDLPVRWTFSGVLRTQSQYDAFVLWVGKRVKVWITDDRLDQYLVRLVRFRPRQEAGFRSRQAPWRMTYSMECLLYRTVESS